MSSRSWRSAPLPPGWSATRKRILRRDDYRCVKCNAMATDVNHILPACKGGGDDEANLESLCQRCHRSETGRQARSMQVPRLRTPEPHPGALPD